MDNKNEEVMPEKIEDLLKAGYKLIDVREQDEWDAGHHSEAEHIPMGTIPENYPYSKLIHVPLDLKNKRIDT